MGACAAPIIILSINQPVCNYTEDTCMAGIMNMERRFLVFELVASMVINNWPEYVFKMVSNFENRYLYGNKSIKGIRICHWNKGSSFLENKMIEVKNLTDQFHPHVLGLSEANFSQQHDQNDQNILCTSRIYPILESSF